MKVFLLFRIIYAYSFYWISINVDNLFWNRFSISCISYSLYWGFLFRSLIFHRIISFGWRGTHFASAHGSCVILDRLYLLNSGGFNSHLEEFLFYLWPWNPLPLIISSAKVNTSKWPKHEFFMSTKDRISEGQQMARLRYEKSIQVFNCLSKAWNETSNKEFGLSIKIKYFCIYISHWYWLL